MFKVLGILFAGILTPLLVFGLLTLRGQTPDIKAVTGSDLSSHAKQKLVEAGIVTESENIEYFYSEDLFSFVNFGNLFTNERVISYELDADTDEKNIYSATYGEISDIEFNKSESMLEDSTIDIYQDGSFSFMLVVSNEENGDEAFHNKLVQNWMANRNAVVQSSVSETTESNSEGAGFAEVAY